MRINTFRLTAFYILIGSLVYSPASANVSALGYFDAGARAYYNDDLEAAKESVNLGLDRFPLNPELKALRDLIEREQQKQEQQKQQQEQQEQEDQSGEDQEGEQQEGEEGSEGEQGESGQEQGEENSEQSQNSSDSGESSQQGEDGEPQDGDGEPSNEKTAEEYAEQSLDGDESDEFGEPEEGESENAADAASAMQTGGPIQMTEEEAMRLLETLSDQEKQLPFITIERKDRDKFRSDKRDY